MALLAPDEGEVNLLEILLGTQDFNLRLYTGLPASSDHPTEDIVFADVAEVTTAGYAAVTLSTTDWGISTISHTTAGTYSTAISFTPTAAVSVMGYYVTDISNTKLFWLEEFDTAPYVLPVGGGSVVVQPKIILE